MKKLLVVLVSLLMVLSLASCKKQEAAPEDGETTDVAYDVNAVSLDKLKLTDTKNYVYADSREIGSMDYLVTALATDHQHNAAFVDGLVETDSKGTYIGSIAESWEANDDSSVWTFHLRKGANWSTSEGEIYDEVKADDFVTGLRHAAEFKSGTAYVCTDVKGFQDYMNNEVYTDEEWAKVGVKALDDYTVEYTLNTPVPYFYTNVEYSSFYPVNRTFLESKGEGCKLGTPDSTACDFGKPEPASILYNGEFILDTFDSKSKISYHKNQNYWDKDNVNFDSITMIYDDGSDPYSVIRGFEQNTYVSAGLSTTWGDEVFNSMMSKYNGYVNPSLPNYYAFGVVFNYNRVKRELTNYASDDAEFAKTRNAILNPNFRLALKSAYDVPAYLSTSAPTDIATATIRNMDGVPNLVSTSDGTQYGTLVEDAYEELTGERVSLADGQWPWLNKEKALGYIEAAKADGVEFPVHLDMLVTETSVRLVKQAQSMKQSIEENTDGNIIIELVMKDADTVEAVAYESTDWKDCDYDISTFTGWGPDYVDPKTFVEIYSPVDGYYMHSIGLTDKGSTNSPEYGQDNDLKEQLGFNEYERLYREADAIKGDIDARYKAFAKADAYLLAKGLYIPTSMQSRSALVSHIVPFTAQYSSGISQYKYKFTQLQEDVVTTEQYNAAKAAWEAE